MLGWLYESYNNVKKEEHKDSKAKTEYNKVSIQSQVYTPRWVVNSWWTTVSANSIWRCIPTLISRTAIKSPIRPKHKCGSPKPLTEVRLIDPATGSGNFLLYAFDLFYDFYLDQIENYGADYDERKNPRIDPAAQFAWGGP